MKRPNISTEYQPKGSDRNQSDTLDRRHGRIGSADTREDQADAAGVGATKAPSPHEEER